MPRDKAEILQIIEKQREANGVINNLTRKFTSWSASVTGTPQYWWSRTNELKAFVGHMLSHGRSSPLFFHTGSAAEYYWKPLHRLLCEYFNKRNMPEYEKACGFIAQGKQVPKHLKQKVFRAIAIVPQIINTYFVLRTEAWFNIMLKQIYGIDE